MKNEWSVHRLSPAEGELIDGLKESFGEARFRGVRHFLSDARNWLTVARTGGRIVAFAYGHELPRLDGRGDMLYIHEVEVLDKYRRRGAGKALLRDIMDRAFAGGISKIFLITQESNTAACSLYRSLGATADRDDDRVFTLVQPGG